MSRAETRTHRSENRSRLAGRSRWACPLDTPVNDRKTPAEAGEATESLVPLKVDSSVKVDSSAAQRALDKVRKRLHRTYFDWFSVEFTKNEASSLLAKFRELSSKIEGLKAEIERLRAENKRMRNQYRVRRDDETGGISMELPKEAAAVIWELIRNRGWTLYEGRLEGSVFQFLKIRGGEFDGKVVVLDGRELHIMPEKAVDVFQYVTPVGSVEENQSLRREIADALAKVLAQYFAFYEIEHKITAFVSNVLPLARAAGIEVGDHTRKKPFLTWKVEKKTIRVYNPEEVYRAWIAANRSKRGVGHVNEGDLPIGALVQTMIDFANYTIGQIASKYPEVLNRAFSIVTERGLPKSKIEEALLKGGRRRETD